MLNDRRAKDREKGKALNNVLCAHDEFTINTENKPAKSHLQEFFSTRPGRA
jgi:hypothetical protein